MSAEPGRLVRLSAPLGVGAMVLVATAALHLRDPSQPRSWGVCPTALVGFDCPFCGGLRGVHHLTDLDLGAAASSNLLLVLAAPVVVVLWVRRVGLAWRGGPGWQQPLSVPRALWWVLLALGAAFTLLRNLPVGAWLAS